VLPVTVDTLGQIGVFFCGPTVLGESIRMVCTDLAHFGCIFTSSCTATHSRCSQACQDIQAENAENGTKTKFSFNMEVF
jgi:hypothetical protein